MSYNLWQQTGKAYHAPTLNSLGSIEEMTQVLGQVGGADHFVFVNDNGTPDDPTDDIVTIIPDTFGFSQDDCVKGGIHSADHCP